MKVSTKLTVLMHDCKEFKAFAATTVKLRSPMTRVAEAQPNSL